MNHEKSKMTVEKAGANTWEGLKTAGKIFTINRSPSVEAFYQREKEIKKHTKKLIEEAEESYYKQKEDGKAERDKKIKEINETRPLPTDLVAQVKAVKDEWEKKLVTIEDEFATKKLTAGDASKAHMAELRDEIVQKEMKVALGKEQSQREAKTEKAVKDNREKLLELRTQMPEKVLNLEKKRQTVEKTCRDYIRLLTNKDAGPAAEVHDYFAKAEKTIQAEYSVQQHAQNVEYLVSETGEPLPTSIPREMTAIVTNARRDLPTLMTTIKNDLDRYDATLITAIKDTDAGNGKRSTELKKLIKDTVDEFNYQSPSTTKNETLQIERTNKYIEIAAEELTHTKNFFEIYEKSRDDDKEIHRNEINELHMQLNRLETITLADRTSSEISEIKTLRNKIENTNILLDIIEGRHPSTQGPLDLRGRVTLSDNQLDRGKADLRTFMLRRHLNNIICNEKSVQARETFEQTTAIKLALKQIEVRIDKLRDEHTQAEADGKTTQAKEIKQQLDEIYLTLDYKSQSYSSAEASEPIITLLTRQRYQFPAREDATDLYKLAAKAQKKYEKNAKRAEETEEHALITNELNAILKDLSFDTNMAEAHNKLDAAVEKLEKLVTRQGNFFEQADIDSHLKDAEEEARKQAEIDPKTTDRIEKIDDYIDKGGLDGIIHKADINFPDEREKTAAGIRKAVEAREKINARTFSYRDAVAKTVIGKAEVGTIITDTASTINERLAADREGVHIDDVETATFIRQNLHEAIKAAVGHYVAGYNDGKDDEDHVPGPLVTAIKGKALLQREVEKTLGYLTGKNQSRGNVDETDESRSLAIKSVIEATIKHASSQLYLEKIIERETKESIEAELAEGELETIKIETAEDRAERQTKINAVALDAMVASARLDANFSTKQKFREQEMEKAQQQAITPEVIRQIRKTVKEDETTIKFINDLAKVKENPAINPMIDEINTQIHNALTASDPIPTHTLSELLNENVGREIDRYIKTYTTSNRQLQPDDQTIKRLKDEVQYAPTYRIALNSFTLASGNQVADEAARAESIHTAVQEAIKNTALVMTYQKRLQQKQDEIAKRVEERVTTYFESAKGKKQLETAEKKAETQIQALAQNEKSAAYEAINNLGNAQVENADELRLELKVALQETMKEHIVNQKGEEARATLQEYFKAFKPATYDAETAKTHKENYENEKKQIDTDYEADILASEQRKTTSETIATRDYTNARNEYNRRSARSRTEYDIKLRAINASGATPQERRAQAAQLTQDFEQEIAVFKQSLEIAGHKRDSAYTEASYLHSQIFMKREAAYSAAAHKYPLSQESETWKNVTDAIDALKADIIETKKLLQDKGLYELKLAGAEATLPTFKINYTHERHRMYYKMQNVHNEIYGEVGQDGVAIPDRKGIIQEHAEAEAASTLAKKESDSEKANRQFILEKLTHLELIEPTQKGHAEDEGDEEGETVAIRKSSKKDLEMDKRVEEIVDEESKKSGTEYSHSQKQWRMTIIKINLLKEDLEHYEKKYQIKKKKYIELQQKADAIKARKEAAIARMIAAKFEYDWVCKRDDVEDARMYRSRDIIQAAMVYDERASRHEAMAQRSYEQALIMSMVQFANQNMTGQRNAMFAKSNTLYQ